MIELSFEHDGRSVRGRVDPMGERNYLIRVKDKHFRGTQLDVSTPGNPIRGSFPYDTQAEVDDKYGGKTIIAYLNGGLVLAQARTYQGDLINPQRGFEFWVSLSKALRECDEMPEHVRDVLESSAHITSLDELFKAMKAQGEILDELFNRDLLTRFKEYPIEFYHPESLDHPST